MTVLNLSMIMHVRLLIILQGLITFGDGVLFKTREKCFKNVGCFSDRKPFNNVKVLFKTYLPDPPDVIQTRFYLYMNNDAPHLLDAYNKASIINSAFDRKLQTKMIIHGFSSNARDYRIRAMKNALRKEGKFNIILVDWSKGADGINYLQAAANIRVVAAETINLLKAMKMFTKLTYDKMHIIGHSLGAHVAGLVGKTLRGIERITGLDPAGPFFEKADPRARIDANDARFVDVIHTDGRKFLGFGLIKAVGDVDFYPNGGKHQPGCKSPVYDHIWNLIRGKLEKISEDVACSHMRALHFFTESITTSCTFSAVPCPSRAAFLGGGCDNCAAGCGLMGYHANRTVHGTFYLSTNASPPFCCI